MRAWGRRHITAIEAESELTFRVVRENGWLEVAIGPAVCLFALYWAIRTPGFWATVFVLIIAVTIIANWLHGNTTELFVTNTELSVRGNVGRVFSDHISVSVNTIVRLEYQAGGEGEPNGLYAQHSYGKTCLLNGLNEEQSIEITTAISRRFSDIGSGDTESGSLLFSRSSELVSLGLSQNK